MKNLNNTNLQVIRNTNFKKNQNSNIYYNLLYEFEKLNVNIKKLPRSTPSDIKVRELIINVVSQVLFNEDIITQIYDEIVFPTTLISKYAHISKEYLLENKNYFLAILAIYKINCEPLIKSINFESKVSNYNFSGIVIEKGVKNNLIFSNTAEFLLVYKKPDLKLGDTYKGVKSYSIALFRKLFTIVSTFIIFFIILFIIYFNNTKAIAIIDAYSTIHIKINSFSRAIGFNANNDYNYYKKNLNIYGKNIDNAIIDAIKASLNKPLEEGDIKIDFTNDGIIYIKITDIESLSNLSTLKDYLDENKLKYNIMYNGILLEPD